MDVQFSIDTAIVPRFYPLIEKGYWTSVREGSTILDFLTEDLSLDSEYVENRIQTIFLNHKPVDDIASAPLYDNDRIAFSAAMPGLLGATMRKAGAYSTMRASISYDEKKPQPAAQPGSLNTGIWIFVKFFNLIVKEIGTDVLKRGIRITGETLLDFIQSNKTALEEKTHKIRIDNQLSSLEEMLTKLDPSVNVYLTVRI